MYLLLGAPTARAGARRFVGLWACAGWFVVVAIVVCGRDAHCGLIARCCVTCWCAAPGHSWVVELPVCSGGDNGEDG